MDTKSVSATLVYWNCLMQLSSQDNFIGTCLELHLIIVSKVL